MASKIIRRGDNWTARIRNPLTQKQQRITRPATDYDKTEFAQIVANEEARLKRLSKGDALPSERPYCPRVSEAAAEWLAIREITPEWLVRQQGLFAIFIDYIGGDMPISEVTHAQCEALESHLRDVLGRSQETIRKDISALKSVFMRSLRHGYIHRDPWVDIRRPKTPPSNKDYFTPDEFKALLRAVDSPERRLRYMLLAYTGARKSEALSLDWSKVDFITGSILFINAQKGAGSSEVHRIVPMHTALHAELRLHQQPSGRVLTHRCNWVRDLNHDAKRAGFTRHLTIHMFRHTFASWLAMSGSTLGGMKSMLGHKLSSTTDRYAHVSLETLRSDMQKICDPDVTRRRVTKSDQKRKSS